MTELYDYLFAQFDGYTGLQLILELSGIFFGLLSVIASARNSILVYPTGIISTIIFVYIYATADLYGDIIINAYYFYMSVYGWILWSKNRPGTDGALEITKANSKDNAKCALIFIVSVIFVSAVFIWFEKFNHWSSYVDTFTTGLFFVGMWLLAKRKLENWIYLIAGDIIVIAVYLYKGLLFTGIFYILLTIIAIFGYLAWKKTLRSERQQP